MLMLMIRPILITSSRSPIKHLLSLWIRLNKMGIAIPSMDHLAVVSILLLALSAAIADIIGGMLIFFRGRFIQSRYVLAFASGVVISTAFFDLIPQSDVQSNYIYLGLGFFLFYLAEKMVLLHACGEEECESHEPSWVSVAAMGGDNIVDGIGIAVAFFVSPIVGVLLTIAIISHEIPQGMSSAELLRILAVPKRTIIILMGLMGGLYVLGAGLSFVLPVGWYPAIIAFVAGGFIYIGVNDLLSEAHKRFNLTVVCAVLLGAGLMFLLSLVET